MKDKSNDNNQNPGQTTHIRYDGAGNPVSGAEAARATGRFTDATGTWTIDPPGGGSFQTFYDSDAPDFTGPDASEPGHPPAQD
jgi:hypothetical protein